jgi:methylated-DNA-[protein]-cysteine S-methyltransferase
VRHRLGPRGIVGVQLPERHARATRERLQRRYSDVPEAPPPEVQRAIDDIIALLRGESRELSNVCQATAAECRFTTAELTSRRRTSAPDQSRRCFEAAVVIGTKPGAHVCGILFSSFNATIP